MTHRKTMKNMRYALLRVAGLAFLLVGCSQDARADRVVMHKTPWFDICKDVHKILQLPENKGYLTPVYDETKIDKQYEIFKIPEAYKDFKQVVWMPSTLEEFSHNAPEEYKEWQGLSIWDITKEKDIAVYKQDLDMAHTGEKHTIFRVVIPYRLKSVDQFETFYAMKEGSKIASDFNEGHETAHPFYYRGKLYLANAFISSAGIGEPKIGFMDKFFSDYICRYEVLDK